MDFKTALFLVFASILIVASLRVITARNPVHAVLFLVLAFFTASMIWMLLKAEFLAIALVLVYVGAVMVLFLFVVMMLDINLDKLREGFMQYLPLGLSIGAVMALEMAFVLFKVFLVADSTVPNLPANYNNTKEIGKVLYTQYAFPFEIAALVLLVAIIAAIALTLRERKDSKAQDPSRQSKVKRADRIRLVDVPSEPRVGAATGKTTGGQA
jgi:NADH-quinone oxidoreductase subunit J